jgi:hypothetical protein
MIISHANHAVDGHCSRSSARGGRGGAVVILQRFGGALNLNILHALVLDGVFPVARDRGHANRRRGCAGRLPSRASPADRLGTPDQLLPTDPNGWTFGPIDRTALVRHRPGAARNGAATDLRARSAATRTGFPGSFVKVTPPAGRGRTAAPVATLQVAVVDKMVIKVAIRNVRARDKQGQMRYHARRPCDPVSEVAQMNIIWTPQTNIVFELIPSTDVDVDHNDPTTRRELAEAYGMKTSATADFLAESTVWSEKNSRWFARHKVPGTAMTFFHVHNIHSGGDAVYGKGGYTAQGTMNRELGVSFISETRLPSTFAHEAGHYIGRHGPRGGRHHAADARPRLRIQDTVRPREALPDDFCRPLGEIRPSPGAFPRAFR